MRLLVTGASGYCGSFMVPHLRSRGHEVETEIGVSCDAIIHMGARSVGTAHDMFNNVETTRRLITIYSGVRLIHFSTVSVSENYFKHGGFSGELDEGTPVYNPSPYALSKLMSESLLDNYDGQAISLRLPGIVGPNSPRNWLSSLMADSKAGIPVRFYNPGMSFNNVIHVLDLCNFVSHLLALKTDVAPRYHVRLVVSCCEHESVAKVVRLIAPTALSVGRRSGHFTINSSIAHTLWGLETIPTLDTILKFVEDNR